MSAADSVWALVSGLPSGPRERRHIMVLQAFIDDSKGDGAVFVLAGYVSTAKLWASFSNEWQSQLGMMPAWKRFKMNEAHARRANVEVFERIKGHYQIIKNHVLLEMCVAVPIPLFEKCCQCYDVPRALRNPYFMAWESIVKLYVRQTMNWGIKEPVEFYFDEQTEKKKIVNAWDQSYYHARQRFQKLIRNMPSFRHDDDLLPLQAADFVAWWKRKQFLETGTVLHSGPLVPWDSGYVQYTQLYDQANEASIKAYMHSRFSKDRYSIATSFQLCRNEN